MAKAGNFASSFYIDQRKSTYSTFPVRVPRLPFLNSKVYASSKRKDLPSLIGKKNDHRAPRPLISIPTSDGRWHEKWDYDYLLSLQDLCLQDLIEVEDQHGKLPKVLIKLRVEKHASFGFSVEGRVVTSFTRKCSNCLAAYCREIDTPFHIWVLPTRRDRGKNSLPEIGGDPSVIYVKPGYDADLDSLIQDTIRLAVSVEDTCSDSCGKSENSLQYVGTQNIASVFKRWSKLSEQKNPKVINK